MIPLRNFFIAILTYIIAVNAMATAKSIIFNYASEPDIYASQAFDIIVVQPYAKFNIKKINKNISQLFSYISLGEISQKEINKHKLNSKIVLGKNKTWHTLAVDQTHNIWHKYILKQIDVLVKKGYQGVFFDTADSFYLFAKNNTIINTQISGQANLIRKIKNRYPNFKIIINRGFYLVPKYHKYIYGIAAESLYAGWNEAQNKYFHINENDRKYLLHKFDEARKYNILCIAIDYTNNATHAKKVAHKILQNNIIPYVTDNSLNKIGISSLEVFPRKIFVVHSEKNPERLATNEFVNNAQLFFEYLGYIPKLHNILYKSMPKNLDDSQFHGVVTWVNLQNKKKLQQSLFSFLNKTKRIGKLPIIFLNNFGFYVNKHNLANFSLQYNESYIAKKPIRVKYKNKNLSDFEYKIKANNKYFDNIKCNDCQNILTLEDSNKTTSDVVSITPWGGYALSPYTLFTLPNQSSRWLINPLKFIRNAVQYKEFPIPDVTTENGRRLLFIHIDGDAAISHPRWSNKEYAADILYSKIYKYYQVPTTVSIVEGEISPKGQYANISKKMMHIAQKTFALPWVEVASHTFAHPFDWQIPEKEMRIGIDSLSLKNYKFSFKREVQGSINFINKYLAPENKKNTILLWSGNCNPTKQTVKYAYDINIYNMNGGNSTITNTDKTWTQIAPLGVDFDGYYQVFAPIQSEYLYTNHWKGPYYGFNRAIETMKLTNKPYRFKPMNIYYHNYIGTEKAGLKSLENVYNWCLKQPHLAIFSSEYAEKVLNYHQLVIARKGKSWIIRNNGSLREFRVPKSWGYPDLQKSKNIIGFSDHGNDLFIHLGIAQSSTLIFTKNKPLLPYLIDSNAKVTKFIRHHNNLIISLKSYENIDINLGNINHCQISHNNKIIHANHLNNNIYNIKLPRKIANDIQIGC